MNDVVFLYVILGLLVFPSLSTSSCIFIEVLTLCCFCLVLAVHIFDVHRNVGCHICSGFLGKCYEGEYNLWMLLLFCEFIVPSSDLWS